MGKSEDVAVIMVPLPSQSHLNRLLQLSALISSHGLPVHYVGSAIHNRQVKLRAGGLKLDSNSRIQFHDFPTPTLTESDLAETTSLQRLNVARAYMDFRGPIGELARQLSANARRIIVICDMYVSEAVGDAVRLPNVEYYSFHVLSIISIFYILCQVMGKSLVNVKDGINDVRSVKELLPEDMIEYLKYFTPKHYAERAGDVYNSTRFMEGTYVDLMESEGVSLHGMTQWALGANLVAEFTSIETAKVRHECLQWLDGQPPRSVIYVSFGTNATFSEEEARELAIGLEQSNQNFIWVVRGADKADIFAGEDTGTRLPEGFEERVKGRGLVLRDWAPQPEILAHGSVGGFMSHCGWNSCLESLTMGVPVAGWALSIDQPINAVLLADVLKVGLIVREWTQREELVKAAAIKDVVERLMASKEGDEIRKRAEEMGAAIRNSMKEGGASRKEMEDFIAHITR